MIHALSFLLVLTLSPERPVVPLTYEPASALAAAVATNGRSQLVAWKQESRDAILIQFLDDSLALRTPEGYLVARSESGPLLLGGAASDGDGYLVVWTDYRRVWAAAVSADGGVAEPRLIGEVTATTSQTGTPRVASNRSGYLVTWVDQASNGSRVYGRMLDRSGAPIGGRFAITSTLTTVRDNKLASNNSEYLSVVDMQDQSAPGEFETRVLLTPVSATGSVGSVRRNSDPSATGALVFDGTTYLIASQRVVGAENLTSVAAVDGSGRVGSAVVASRSAFDAPGFAALASNGNGSLVLNRTSSGPTAVRLAPGGMPLDTAARPLPVTELSASIAAGAAPEGRYFVAGLRPLAGARMPASLDAEILIAPQAIALAAAQQSQPRVVPVGAGHVVTIREGTRLLANGAEVTPLALRSTLASDGARALVVWSDRSAIRGRYVDAAGVMSDPFVIATAGNTLLNDAVAVDGGFVVIWEQAGGITRARVGAADTPRRLFPTTASGGAQVQGALARTSAGFVAVYTESVPTTGRNMIRSMAFGADAASTGPLQTIADTSDAESSPDVASDGAGHLLAVWSAAPASGPAMLHAAMLAEDGSIAGASRILGEGTTPRVSWTGNEFVIVSGGSVAVVSREGEVLQPLTPTLGPALETTAGGRAIAYVKPGASDQVMVRTIGAGGGVRRRAVR